MQLRASTEHTMGWRYSEIIDEWYSYVRSRYRDEDTYTVGKLYDAQPRSNQDNSRRYAPTPLVEESSDTTEQSDVQPVDMGLSGEDSGLSEGGEATDMLPTVAPLAPVQERANPLDTTVKLLEVEFT